MLINYLGFFSKRKHEWNNNTVDNLLFLFRLPMLQFHLLYKSSVLRHDPAPPLVLVLDSTLHLALILLIPDDTDHIANCATSRGLLALI